MRCLRFHWILSFLAMFVTTGVLTAEATIYLSTEQALQLAFPTAERIERTRISLTQQQRDSIEKRAHVQVPFTEIEIWTALTQEQPLGHAMIHDVKGKARPITYMVVIGPGGRVDRVEILAYRESHGYEVRYPSFLKQFFGKSLSDPIRNHQDILNISGATISCRAIADGVRLLLGVWEEFYGKEVAP